METHVKIKFVVGIIMASLFASLAVAGEVLDQQAYSSKEHVMIPNADGVPLSTVVYYPRGFTPASTYPAIIVSHGDVLMKEMMAFFSLELVNRGWIVVAYDFRNHGQSGIGPGGTGTVYDTQAIFQHVWDTMPFVNQSAIGLLGHSRGGLTSMKLSEFAASQIAATVNVAGPAWNVTLNQTQPRNLLIIAGDEDVNVLPAHTLQILYNATGGGLTVDHLYGDFASGTARKLHYVAGGHTKILFLRETYTEAITWFEHTFYGAVRSPVSTSFETRLVITIATAIFGFATIFWGFFAVHHVLVARQIVQHRVMDDPTPGRKKRVARALAVNAFLLPASIGGASAGIYLLLRAAGLDSATSLGFHDLVPATDYIMSSILPILVAGVVAMLAWAMLRVARRVLARREVVLAAPAFTTIRAGKAATSLALGVGFFVLFYYVVSIAASPLFNTLLNPNRLILFLYLAMMLLVPSLGWALLTFDGIQGLFPKRHFQDSWVTLLLGMVGRGIAVGILLATRLFYMDTLVFFLIFMGAGLIFSMVSFHYFRDPLQEAVFNTLLLAWVFTSVGIIAMA